MEPADPETVEVVVEDSFPIRGRGWVLAPALGVDRFPANAKLAIDLEEPGGASRSLSGRFLVEHVRLRGGGSRWNGVIVLDEGETRVPPGSRLVCRVQSPQASSAPGGWNALHAIVEAGVPAALIAVDVDWTQAFHDAYGPQQGDLMLARVQRVVEELAGACGARVVRTGGDDFVVVLSPDRSDEATTLAEQMRASVYELDIPFEHPEVKTHGRVTVSVSVLRPAPGASATKLREMVEDALYEAKRAGRNRVGGDD